MVCNFLFKMLSLFKIKIVCNQNIKNGFTGTRKIIFICPWNSFSSGLNENDKEGVIYAALW